MKSSDDAICRLTTQLTHIRKRKISCSAQLKRLDSEEKEVAFQLNSALGIVPIQEAAERVQRIIDRAKTLSSQNRSRAMRELWASKTVEERTEWKRKLRENRCRRIGDHSISGS